MAKSIFLLAQEASADVLGAQLMQWLLEKEPDLQFTGVGGKQMQELGLVSICPITDFEIMGFTAIIKAAFGLFKNFRKLKRTILRLNPDMVISIDYPDFNMLLGRALRKKKYAGKLIHYVVPSVWAWRKKRIQTFEKHYDLLLSILPFEKELFKKGPLEVAYIGHPLCEKIKHHSYDCDWKPDARNYISIFPGSRTHEIQDNLELQIQAAQKLQTEGLKVSISCANEHQKGLIEKIVKKYPDFDPILVPSSLRYEHMRATKIALATCGTVILELALHKTPTLVIYKISRINYFLGRYIFRIRLPHFSLPNIILKKELFPEVIGQKLTLTEIELALQKLQKKEVDGDCTQLMNQLSQDSQKLCKEAIL